MGTSQRVATMMDDVPRLHRQLDDLVDDRFGVVADQGRVTLIAAARLVVDDLVGWQDDPLVFGVALLAASTPLAGRARYATLNSGAIRGRWSGGVRRILSEPGLELDHAGSECRDLGGELSSKGLELSDIELGRRGERGEDFLREWWRHRHGKTLPTLKQLRKPVNGYGFRARPGAFAEAT